ncbi:MAG TPA: ABC transporter ATP-binding protein [Deltaproteobacteria bacterium]|nr:ABC transporter ATP-binding protein [Deltaproteobacteria bacterium]
MASIELKDFYHTYDARMGKGETSSFCIENLNIKWGDGKAIALLGPSGCGKTTLLNAISGLIHPKGGSILFNGQDVTALSTKERHVAQVFQFPVVYDSMDVYGNLAFPLKNDRVPRNEIDRRVKEIAGILEIEDLLELPAGNLIPADKQKVSLGRGIIRPDTAAVLLDEPLTVIDPKLQWTLRRKLKQVQRQLGITMVYVTHDQHEALTFADIVTIMSNDGKIAQTGTPEEIHNDPYTPFVGYFIGSPGMNIMECSITSTGFDFDDFAIPIPVGLNEQTLSAGDNYQFGIRPEFVQASMESRDGWLPFTIEIVEDTGAYKITTLKAGKHKIKARIPEEMPVVENNPLWVHFPDKHIKLFQGNKRVF